MNDRAGTDIHQPTGYRSFLPKPLPPDPPVRVGAPTSSRLLSGGRPVRWADLDGLARSLPSTGPVRCDVRHDVRRCSARRSKAPSRASTICSRSRAAIPGTQQPIDIAETVNYIKAMNRGSNSSTNSRLSGRLIRRDPQRTTHRRTRPGTKPGPLQNIAELDRTARMHPQHCNVHPPAPRRPSPRRSSTSRSTYNDSSIPPIVQAGALPRGVVEDDSTPSSTATGESNGC